MEDAMIVELYHRRDESAICETERKYGAYLTKIACNILADTRDAEESVSDTYLGAWRSMPPHRPGVLRTFLAKLARRASIDVFRRRTREKRLGSEYAISLDELSDCVSGGGEPEEELELRLLGEAIDRFLRSASEDARNAFIGRYYFLDPLREVAAYCGMSEGGAKSLLHRTRRALREYLIKEGFVL